MKKLCFFLCLLLTLAVLTACSPNGNNDETTPQTTTSEKPKEKELALSVSGSSVDGGITIGVGESKQITAIETGSGKQVTVSWQSDNETVAAVDFEGKVTGVSDGTAVITATTVDGSLQASCTVKVTSVLENITLEFQELTLNKGSSFELKVGLIPESYSGAVFTWVSGDDTIASVEDGVVTAHKDGSTTIAVSSEGKTAVCTITVITPVTSVTLSEDELYLSKGDRPQLLATVLPTDATDSSLTWTSSAPNVVTIGPDGMLIALSSGSATITVESVNGIKATCDVQVYVSVSGVTIVPSEVSLEIGTTQTLELVIEPADANIRDVIWKCSDYSVVSVLNGEITALKPGTATVTVETVEGNFTASCVVTVTNPITALTFDPAQGSLLLGQTITLTPAKTPLDADITPYIWTSSEPTVATVDENGVITTLLPGTTTITVATEKGVSATYELTVIDPASLEVPISGIHVGDKAVEVSENFKLSITLTPSDATEEYIIQSSNTSYVVVNSDGTLTALKKGNVLITVTNMDGTVSATCLVSVREMSTERREAMQKLYNDELAVIEAAHKAALDAIGAKYDESIEAYKNAIQNAEDAGLNDETVYNDRKATLLLLIETVEGTDKENYQNQLEQLENDWTAYCYASERLPSAESSKASEVFAENDSYRKKVAELDAKYPFLFE